VQLSFHTLKSLVHGLGAWTKATGCLTACPLVLCTKGRRCWAYGPSAPARLCWPWQHDAYRADKHGRHALRHLAFAIPSDAGASIRSGISPACRKRMATASAP